MKITVIFLAALVSAAVASPVGILYSREPMPDPIAGPEADPAAWHGRQGASLPIWQKRSAVPEPLAEPWNGRPGRGIYRREPWNGRPGRGIYRRYPEAWHARQGPPAYTLPRREAQPEPEPEPEPIRFQPIGEVRRDAE